jgi:hypothetical protein
MRMGVRYGCPGASAAVTVRARPSRLKINPGGSTPRLTRVKGYVPPTSGAQLCKMPFFNQEGAVQTVFGQPLLFSHLPEQWRILFDFAPSWIIGGGHK